MYKNLSATQERETVVAEPPPMQRRRSSQQHSTRVYLSIHITNTVCEIIYIHGSKMELMRATQHKK